MTLLQLKMYADQHKNPSTPSNGTSTPQASTSTPGSHPAFRAGADASNLANNLPTEGAYPISTTLATTNPGAVQWAQTRPTLTGGMTSGRVSGDSPM